MTPAPELVSRVDTMLIVYASVVVVIMIASGALLYSHLTRRRR